MKDTITLEVNNINYTGFTDISVNRTIEAVSGTFSFNTTINNGNVFPIKTNDKCRVLINNTPVINGFVEKVSVSYDSGTHTISIEGRDKTADIVDSSVKGSTTFNAPISLTQVIRNTLDNLGLTGVGIINNAGIVENFDTGDIISAEPAMNCFEFLEQYARKRQLFLFNDGNGNIVLTRASGNRIGTRLLGIIGGQQNNILRSSVSYDYTKRFNSYKIISQFNPSGGAAGENIENGTDINGTATDSAIRSSRFLALNGEESMSTDTATNRTTWEANIRRARSQTYTCDVYGFTAQQDGLIWQPNFLVRVIDNFADVDAELLVKSVSFSFSNSAGSVTSLELVVKDAYTLQAQLDKLQANSNPFGEGFIDEPVQQDSQPST